MRSLILAGGGLKVGYQAGVLQVWLDEAGLEFDHADGASGGCLNLAMYCEGRSGSEIAEAWRESEPIAGVDMDLGDLMHARSLFSLDRYRENVLRSGWGLDWDRIRTSRRLGTFNLCNFDRQELVVLENRAMDEDRLISAISLPMWFPPVEIDAENYIDAVYLTDGNLEEAIRRGADEIWAVWTVSREGRWRHGFVNQFFQIVEIAANGRFFDTWQRIERNNDMIRQGYSGEFGRHIELRLLQAEVPVHYLLNFSRDRMAEAVNRGVRHAREWCRQNGVQLNASSPVVTPTTPEERSGISFTEEMKGHATPGIQDPVSGSREAERQKVSFEVTIRVADIEVFATDPSHAASATGWVDVSALGGRQDIVRGTFQLFADETNPFEKRMLYRLWFNRHGDDPFTLSGEKRVRDDPDFDVWEDTTTLFFRIYHGHLEAVDEDGASVWGAGVLRIHTIDLVRQLATMRAHGPDRRSRATALRRFARLFLGNLLDTYGQDLVPFGPI